MKQKPYGPHLRYQIHEYGAYLGACLTAYLLERGGNVPDRMKITLMHRNWIHIWNQPRLYKKWGFKRKRFTEREARWTADPGHLWLHWQGRDIPLLRLPVRREQQR